MSDSTQDNHKTLLGNVGELVLKSMGQVTKSHLHNLFGVLHYYDMYIDGGPSHFCEMSVKCN